ncbi:methyl-accepting chemotaxis protein [Jeotgalibacillus soli]|uniref:Methyl-accepting chemotaxis protein n=1 Tax=Jeotgalibacillus soli TaxID=889306 RepID=A0A0C2VKX6_9BACL|nr:methyl-accepting chemotaxis protein [Jeotgalibacillus soli]KIL49522.1 hypothetical protein KP78_09900 [Jeotgalibacillus soli]
MSKKKKLKLGTKINLIVVSIIVFLSSTLAIAAIWQINDGIKTFAVEKARGDLDLSYRYIDNKYPGDWEIRDGHLYKGSTLLNENYEVVDNIGSDTGDTVTIFQMDTRIATNVMVDGERAIGTTVSDEVAEVVLQNGENYYGEANVAGNDYQTAYMPIQNAAGETVGIYYVGAAQSIIDDTIAQFLTILLIVLAVIIVLSAVFTIWFTRRLKKRLNAVSTALNGAGNGDFTTEIVDNTGDELTEVGNSYNQMRGNLQGMIQEVLKTSEQVAASSEELTAGAEQTSLATEQITEIIQQVASNAENQTASVEQSETALEEVTIGINNIAERSTHIAEKGSYATDKAKKGGDLVGSTAAQMNTIHDSVNVSAEVMELLDERSKEIGKITNVITDIANQTNLLALNAAIEAARAGEHGKGFAVVADEVRKLAEQSQLSSTQISALINEIQVDMSRSNESITQVKAEVQEGLGIVQDTQESFKEIISAMEDIGYQINDMAATAQQMSASAEEVTATVSGITTSSKENAMHSQGVAASTEEQLASMEEISASAAALSNMAEDLQNQMAKFKIR